MGSIFLEIKHLMALTGSNSYNSTQKKHKAIRDSIALNKRTLTIREYCKEEGLDEEEIREALRKKGFNVG